MFARVLRVIAVTLVVLIGIVAGLFLAGEALTDPGGWKALLLITTWAVPVVALSVMALVRPDLSSGVLPVVLALVAGSMIVDNLAHIIDRDTWGPAGTIAMLAVLVPCGLLGAHRAATAGWLLLAGTAVQLVATVVNMDRAGGQSLRSAVGGSTGVIVPPFLVLAALFLAVAAAERWHGHAHDHTPRLDHVHGDSRLVTPRQLRCRSAVARHRSWAAATCRWQVRTSRPLHTSASVAPLAAMALSHAPLPADELFEGWFFADRFEIGVALG